MGRSGKSSLRNKSKRTIKRLSSMDILNETGFALGANINMVEVEEEGSVELDESEVLFLD